MGRIKELDSIEKSARVIPMSKMEWTKEKQEDGDNYYKCGRFSIEPIIGDSYYKQFMNGIPSECRSINLFPTLSAAKNYARQVMNELEPAKENNVHFEIGPELFQRCKAAFIDEWMAESKTVRGLPTDIGGWFAHYDVRCTSEAREAGRKVALLQKST